jgi:hypothetical protein
MNNEGLILTLSLVLPLLASFTDNNLFSLWKLKKGIFSTPATNTYIGMCLSESLLGTLCPGYAALP